MRCIRLLYALFKPIKPVVNVGFVLLQKRGNGGGRKPGRREHVKEIILFFPCGKNRTQLCHDVVVSGVQGLLHRPLDGGVRAESLDNGVHLFQDPRLEVFRTFIYIVLLAEPLQGLEGFFVGRPFKVFGQGEEALRLLTLFQELLFQLCLPGPEIQDQGGKHSGYEKQQGAHELLEVTEEVGEGHLLVNHAAKVLDLHALLLHGIALAYSHAAVTKAVVVNCDAERRTNGILAAITLADGVFFVVLVGEIILELIHNFLGKLRQAVFLDKRHDGYLDGSQGSGNTHYNALLAVFKLLYCIGMGKDGKAHTVYADGGLDYVRSVGGVFLGVKVFYLLAGELLMVTKVEVCTAVDTLKLLEAEGEVELDVRGCIGIVGKLLMVMEAVVFGTHTKVYMPFHAGFLPFFEPFQLCSGLDKELHFHLLELPHAEDELTGHNLITEGLAYLGDTEGDLHTAGLLDIEVVHKYSLGSFRAQIDEVCTVCGGAHGGGEHEVELAHFRPVAGAGNRADYITIDNYLPIFSKIIGFFSSDIAVMDLIPLCLLAKDIGVGCTELLLVERVPEFLAALGHFLLYFLLNLTKVILNEDIGPVTLFGVLIVNEGVVEGTYVAGCFPNAGMHKDGAVNAHDVLIEAGHCLPPVVLDVVFELYAHLAIVIYSGQTVINL